MLKIWKFKDEVFENTVEVGPYDGEIENYQKSRKSALLVLVIILIVGIYRLFSLENPSYVYFIIAAFQLYRIDSIQTHIKLLRIIRKIHHQ